MAVRMPIGGTTLKMLLAVGILYLIMMGSTFSSLGVVLPHMMKSLGMDFSQGGLGFTLLALAAGLSSILPGMTIKRWGGRATLGLGVLIMVVAYGVLAVAYIPAVYYAGATLLGFGFSFVGAVPALHILARWEDRNRPLVFGVYLAFGGLGGALWPTIVESVIAGFGGWRNYWWFMVALMSVAGILALAVLRERQGETADDAAQVADGWRLAEALRTPQFYVIGGGIAATYFIASTINAFTMSYLTMIGISTSVAIAAFSVQSACHAAFPLLMGGIAARVGARNLLVFGLVIQVIGMVALAGGKSVPLLMIFAVGVGGGYGTIFLATTYSLQTYFGHRNYAQIFGANQMFTTIAVLGPVVIGWVADVTGRFDISWGACAALLAAAAAWATTLRRPAQRQTTIAIAAE